ncbi:2',3'-cyclic-nucleotide 2'-phosphodiesterase (5'-nucleotidase family) [Marinobacterium halophilum]|uniref:2',3'-cyclic-nucleotide 2'-phosphodiesterase (5'-nucleotidase family) n=1 Tax=Marinobacterium halophilum TaxID=267374 RepID=A0A2P8EXE2_9GAMM|nr:5'-nucleotidase C-terminal domain-containing protein [Marinobacterium halophilum]PSL14124.1 2',3'-cyclic-nucleotide 2'-phosphodiesterase (5'-nucleotidase family) [Marinobacterium halophilum]
MANYTLQILHASDMEGGGGDLRNAPAFVSIVDYLEDQTTNSLFLSSGDLILPGPFMSAAGDRSLREAIQLANEKILGLEPGTLNNLREGAGRVDLTLANLLEASAITLGNHEFDLGTSALAGLIGTEIRSDSLDGVRWLGAQFPYLSANLDFSGDDSLSGLFTDDIINHQAFSSTIDDLNAATSAPKIAPSTIVEKGGEKIGIIGATTQILESISSTGGVQVKGTDANNLQLLAQQLQVHIDQLKAEGVNKIILMSHLQQISLEEELAGLLDGVDIIMAGGSNALLADADEALFPGTGQTPYRDYPILTKDAAGNDVVLVNTDGGWRYVGQLNVEFDVEGNIITDSINDDTSTLYTATDATAAELWGSEEAAYAKDSKGAIAQELVGAVDELVTAKDGITFGSTDVYLQGERTFVRTEETNLGNLTADANLWYARQLDNAVMVSIKNGGGVREPIGTTYAVGSDGDYELRPPQANDAAGKKEGDVSQLDIESSLRFNNDLSILTLTRAQLLAAIEHAVSASDENSTPGQFAQVAGIRYSFDWTREAGDRIQSAAVLDEYDRVQDVLVVNGELVGDAAATIKVVTLGFMADGGDGYPFGEFLELNTNAVERIDLVSAGLGDGTATEAAAGTEQDAFAEYMQSAFSAVAFAQVDTNKSEDMRIQNLAFKEDEVLANNTDAVVRLYDTLFDRTPDTAGLAHWHEQLQQGARIETIATAFMASHEYQQGLGNDLLDNVEFIDILYQNAFGRSAETAGAEYWLSQLEEQPALNVILAISESPEHVDLLL